MVLIMPLILIQQGFSGQFVKEIEHVKVSVCSSFMNLFLPVVRSAGFANVHGGSFLKVICDQHSSAQCNNLILSPHADILNIGRCASCVNEFDFMSQPQEIGVNNIVTTFSLSMCLSCTFVFLDVSFFLCCIVGGFLAQQERTSMCHSWEQFQFFQSQ